MSQSKTDVTRSGWPGTNWQLSSLKSLCRKVPIDDDGCCRARSSAAASIVAACSGLETRSQRLRQPASWRSRNPSGRPRSARPTCLRIGEVQIGEGVDGGQPDAAGGVGQVGHRRRQRRPDHLAAAVLADDEVGTDDVVVLAQHERPGSSVVLLPEARQHPVLTRHVVGPRRDDPERRPAQNEPTFTEREQVGEVGRAVGELQHAHRGHLVGELQLRAEILLEPVPWQLLAGANRRQLDGHLLFPRLGHVDSTVHALTPGAP